MRLFAVVLLGALAATRVFAAFTVSANDVPSRDCMRLVGQAMTQVHPRMKKAEIELVAIDELLGGDTSGLDSALEILKVDEAVRAKILEGFRRVHAHRALYPFLHQIYQDSEGKRAPAAPLCLVAGECQDHDLVWVPLVPQYTSSAGPFTGDGAKDPARDQLVRRFSDGMRRLRPAGTPEGLIAINADELVGKTGDPEKIGYDFAAKLFHELAHRTTNRIVAAWIEKNRRRVVPDALFQRYVRIVDDIAVIEHGFTMFVGESLSERAYCEARWAMVHDTPPSQDTIDREFLVTMAVEDYGAHFQNLQAGGRYGQDTVRFLAAGLHFGDKHYPLTQANFLMVGLELEIFMRQSSLAVP